MQCSNKSIKIEPDRFRVVIRIRALLDANIFEYGIVIGCMVRAQYLFKCPYTYLREATHVPHVGLLR